ncbi:unnamed protein product, partial [marine sediment metagenome]
GVHNITLSVRDDNDPPAEASDQVVITVVEVNPAPGELAVTPAGGLDSSGNEGGPFSPDSKEYTLKNVGGEPMNWTATPSVNWVEATPPSGTLAPGATAAVTVSINSKANSLGAGSYDGNVSFTNTTNHNGDTSRVMSLTVHAPPGAILIPGSGFSGPTAQPDPVGSGPGVDAKAIARWDVVPFQTFDGDFNVGVVAFHINGIDRVEFAVDGGPWLSISEMSENARVGVWEYWAAVRASDFADGEIELRAIAYPLVGIPRVLDSLFLCANA